MTRDEIQYLVRKANQIGLEGKRVLGVILTDKPTLNTTDAAFVVVPKDERT